MSRVIRAGVVGCGGRGKLYARLAAGMDDLEVVAFADVNRAGAETALAEFGGDYATAEIERIWADESLEAVVIATWHDTHTPFCQAAAAAGKHIFIEKPLALTVAECEAIGESVRRAGVKLVAGFKLDFCPVVRAVKERVGTPWLLTGQMMDNPWPTTHWATQPGTGGGNVLSQGCHTADLLRFLAGAEPVKVAGFGGTFSGQHPAVIDNVVASIAYANGAVASLVQGDLGENRQLSKFFFQVWGRDGAWAHLDTRLHRAVVYRRGAEPEEIVAAQLGSDDRLVIEGDYGVLRAFVEAVKGDGPAEPGVLAGTQATRTITGIFESIRTGQVVELA
ncbi:MAG: Gfo/Idh/MocA family oxidoreductase [Armatimonadetes bacterium]|nr:Gfo/Idh/MocA family oxidoreductase [Armatimonadota bacterium]